MQDLADDTTNATACYDLMRTVAEGDLDPLVPARGVEDVDDVLAAGPVAAVRDVGARDPLAAALHRRREEPHAELAQPFQRRAAVLGDPPQQPRLEQELGGEHVLLEEGLGVVVEAGGALQLGVDGDHHPRRQA